MATLSVVVPIYNVEDFLEPCLDSIAGQTFEDLEVVLVNDGSTDSSPQIAEAYSERDPRFKVVHRENGGLSAARNTGIEHATGDYLAFVDSDDVLLPDAYERMVGSLEKTGSDFATGNVLRLAGTETRPARFLKKAFRDTRLRTHITKFRPLLHDRIAWNKVFRRSFWDAHGLTFPEGRINEDIPVILPLHFSASAVDVLSDPVYLWRFRDTGELSITERRLETRALLHRVQALQDVHDYLKQHASRKEQRWYDETIVADDLKYYLNVLDQAGDEYRALFLEKVGALLADADDDIYDGLQAIERLKWHLVRRGLMDELVEVIEFQRGGEMAETPPVKVGRHWEGDYPFRGDARLNIPDHIYRLGDELRVSGHVDFVGMEDGRLRIDGTAFIQGIGAAAENDQRVSLMLLPPGRLRRLRYLISTARFKTRSVHRPEVNARVKQGRVDVAWSGFSATMDPRRLRQRGRFRPGRWDLYVVIRAGGIRRARNVFTFGTLPPVSAVELPAADDVLARAMPTGRDELSVDIKGRWASLRSHEHGGGALELTGEGRRLPAAPLRLELREVGGNLTQSHPATASGNSFTARVPLDEVTAALEERSGPGPGSEHADPAWDVYLTGKGGRVRVALPEALSGAEASWAAGAREVSLARTTRGEASLAVRAPRTALTAARAGEAGDLIVEGERLPAGDWEFVLFSADRLVQHPFPVERSGESGFRAVATPAAIQSLAGSLALPEGLYELRVRPAGDSDVGALRAVAATAALETGLPLRYEVAHKAFTLVVDGDDNLTLKVGRDLDDDERGSFNQRRIRERFYSGKRTEPLADAVVFASFRGRQYSDSPRAIHEELVRRGSPLEQQWVVRDGACEVPATAKLLRQGSRDQYEAFARARYIVVNDHFPDWFRRRPDQICVQTWHGTPLKRLGFDVSQLRGSSRKFEREWDEQKVNWQYVVSPNRFSTPILKSAYEVDPERMLETGYPRDDYLAGANLDQHTRDLRARLGLPEGKRIVLYAPTYRDNVQDRRGRYRLEQKLDIDRMRDALGNDAVILYRKHHYVVDDVPTTADGFVRDVSAYPDGTELLLAADVLVTDYSSMIVDFANTGRPMLFFAYDLDAYRDEMRGFYVPFEETVPGPLLTTSGELAEALRDPDAIRAEYAAKYDAFTQKFCELDDGGAAARVVDEVFGA